MKIKKAIYLMFFLGIFAGILLGVSPLLLGTNTAEDLTIQEPINPPEIHQITPPSQPQFISATPKQYLIDRQQLWNHVEAIAGERYQEVDRQATRDYLIQQLESFGFSPSLQPFEQGVNIVAKRPGTDSGSGSILLGAHYDTVLNSPGADDNGSGIAVILEIARLLSKEPTTRSLEIAFFDQEELGLLGSFAFVQNEENINDLQAAIILDMVGYACRTPGCQQYPEGLTVTPVLEAAGVEHPDLGEFLIVVGETQQIPLLKTFETVNQSRRNQPENAAKIPPLVTLPIPLKGLLTPDVLRSDHAPFWYQGIAAVLLTDTANLRSPHYHQPSDTITNLDPEFFEGSAQVILDTVTQLLSVNKN